MKKFAVYQNEENDVVLVQEGFNMLAAIFTGFWALYNKIWPLFFVALFLNSLQWLFSSPEILFSIKLLAFLSFGLLGDFAYQIYLERKGYNLVDVVIAKNADSAEVKFYERNRFEGTSRSKLENPWE
jgi:hypothetical protein